MAEDEKAWTATKRFANSVFSCKERTDRARPKHIGTLHRRKKTSRHGPGGTRASRQRQQLDNNNDDDNDNNNGNSDEN